MKHRLPYALLFSTIFSFTPILPLQADWLDRKDTQYEKVFQQTDAAFDKALREGVQELDLELTAIWGETRQLPEPKVWVGYSQDRKTRIVVDYDRGEMFVEGFARSEQDLLGEFQDILLEDSPKLDERAALRRKLIEKTKDFWAETEDPERNKTQRRVKRPTVKWQPSRPSSRDKMPRSQLRTKRELSTLVEPKARPRFVKRSTVLSKGKMARLSRLTIPLRKDRDRLSAQALRDPISEMAQKYKLPPSLILSVIKNESAFNPRARSHANALGLMQLVATSGGKDAYSFLMGYDAVPSPEILYDPIENIKLGATYLHLLNTRFFGKVKDRKTRQYLIIAAYNTGAGNVAKAFTGKIKLTPAIQKINQMSPEDVYTHLQKHLPYAETKTYLARVAKDIQAFTDWDNRV